ncbi:pentatricopeptide repeat-containing protein At2g02750-like [Silene latifolia]|uniref:pentatricopeptide repeat-containing protein At2g02750-like n=1 Tax=Silene latifolia TaxID=37657 RepID=UPI003D78A11F
MKKFVVNHMKPNIVKLVSDGHFKQALHLYTKLHSSSTPCNLFTFPCLLKACSKLNNPINGYIVHCNVIKSGFVSDIYAATGLTHMYATFGEMGNAHQLFDEMSKRNVASVTALVSGYCQNGCFKEGFRVFKEIGLREFRPSSVTIASVLSACEDVDHGSQVHCWGTKIGVERDVFVGTGLLTMYMSCGEPVLGTKVFEMMVYKNVVSYNAFVTGLIHNGVYRVVFKVFKHMLGSSDQLPNSGTFVSVLGACSSVTNLHFGRQVHGFTIRVGLQAETMVGTALVDMYAKCGSVMAYHVFREMDGNRSLVTWNSVLSGLFFTGDCDTALELFSELESVGLVPDSATWNTMISGLSRQGNCLKAFQLFANMVSRGIVPSLKVLTSILVVCSVSLSLQRGKEIHAQGIKAYIDNDEFFVTSLIDLYMKCGQPTHAHKIFDQLTVKPVKAPIWNAMISGYGRNGMEELAFSIFNLMLEMNVEPNSTTFTTVLSVCSHTGQVDKALQVFEMMTKDYDLVPTPQHFACIVDLLGRSGHLEKARELMKQIPENSVSMFYSLLGAAGYHFDSELGEYSAEVLSKLEPGNSAPYVVMSNIYAAMGRWKDAERMRDMMVIKGVEKNPGYSLPMA